MMTTNRRSFLSGLAALVAAPAIVKAESLMPVKIMRPCGPLVVHVNPALRWGNAIGWFTLDSPKFHTIPAALDFIASMKAPESEIHLAPGTYRDMDLTAPLGKHKLLSYGDIRLTRSSILTDDEHRFDIYAHGHLTVDRCLFDHTDRPAAGVFDEATDRWVAA